MLSPAMPAPGDRLAWRPSALRLTRSAAGRPAQLTQRERRPSRRSLHLPGVLGRRADEGLSGMTLAIPRRGTPSPSPVARAYCARARCWLGNPRRRPASGPARVTGTSKATARPRRRARPRTPAAHTAARSCRSVQFDPGVSPTGRSNTTSATPAQCHDSTAAPARAGVGRRPLRIHVRARYAYSGLPPQFWRLTEDALVERAPSPMLACRREGLPRVQAFLAHRRQALGLGEIAAWAATRSCSAAARWSRAASRSRSCAPTTSRSGDASARGECVHRGSCCASCGAPATPDPLVAARTRSHYRPAAPAIGIFRAA